MTQQLRTGATRASKPAALATARRNRAIGASVATCMVAGLAIAAIVQPTISGGATAAAAELPSVAELSAAQPQSYQANLASAVNSSRDESVELELEPEPTPEPAPATTSSSDSSGESSSDSSGGGGGYSYPAGGSYDPGSIQGIAQQMLADRGMGDQWGCFEAIIGQESGWNPYAQNPSSGAYGIPQALPGSKMASHGSDWATNPATQLAWAIDYMNGRYGSPCGAYDFKFNQGNGWY